MSAKVTGMIWERAIRRTAKIILLRMADHGDDQGKSIFPGMESLADHTECDERTVQRNLRDFEALGVLVDVGEVHYGRGKTRGWHIDLEVLRRTFPTIKALKAATTNGQKVRPPSLKELLSGWKLSGKGEEKNPGTAPPFGDGENLGTESQKGGIENAKPRHDAPPEPLRTVIEPSRARGSDPDGPPREPEEQQDPPSQENAHWRASETALNRRFGEVKFRTWLAPLIAAKDEGPGKRLILWAPSQFMREKVVRDYADKIGQLINRRIEVVVVAPHERHEARQKLEASQ